MYFIHYSNYKNIWYMWRGIKTIPRPQEFYCAGTMPLVLKLLDPPMFRLKSTWIQKMPNSYRRRNSVSMRVGVGVVSPPPPLCKHVQEINDCTSYINQIYCFKNHLHAECFFVCLFGSLTISRLFNVLYLLICYGNVQSFEQIWDALARFWKG